MNENVRVGLIGYGMAGSVFHAPLINAAPGIVLSAVSSSHPDKVLKDNPAVRVVESPRILMEDDSLDLIVIASPNGTHFSLAQEALSAGRNVVVDKPFTLNLKEAEILKKLAEEKGLFLSVFQNRRWDGDFLTLRSLVESGALGRIVTLESRFDRFRPQVTDRWREQGGQGGGIWYDLGSHLVDQAVYLFGMPDTITLDLAKLRKNAQVEDYFHALLDYSGLRVILHASSLVALKTPRFVLNGTEGSYKKCGLDTQESFLKQGIRPNDPDLWKIQEPDGILVQEKDGFLVTDALPTQPGDYVHYYEAVACALRDGGENPVPPDQAVNVMRLMEAGLVSAREGRRVPL